jgi:hypothetical protein
MPRQPTGRPTGRPPGKDFPVRRNVLLTEEDLATLERLASAWDVSTTEVVRRVLRAEGERLRWAERRKEKE